MYSPTGPLNRDYDDVRSIGDAAVKGIKKAITVGSKKPLLVNAAGDTFKLSNLVSLLAALDASYNVKKEETMHAFIPLVIFIDLNTINR